MDIKATRRNDRFPQESRLGGRLLRLFAHWSASGDPSWSRSTDGASPSIVASVANGESRRAVAKRASIQYGRMIFRCLLLVGLLMASAGCNADKISRLEKENRELAAKLDTVTKAANLDLQKKCADQASAMYKELGWNKESLAGYTNHYQQKLNKCFIQIQNTKVQNKVPTVSITVQDAFEGKGYAEYFWMNREGKKYWEVKPFICRVNLLSGEEKTCQSQEEFEELVKVYMEQ